MGRLWTRDEEILALTLYSRIPFGQISSRHHEIIHLAQILGRSPASVSMKMGNFARFDPTLQARGVGGLSNGSHLDEEVWDEFCRNFEYLEQECRRVVQENNFDFFVSPDNIELPEGRTVQREVNARVNQDFFRSAVLQSYENKCCITGMAMPALLIASHIKPWASSDPETERTNPKNGLCLNALHDRAFDQGLITVDTDFRIVVSKMVRDMYTADVVREYFGRYDGKLITQPYRFSPDKEFLEYHNSNIFIG